MKQPQLFSTLIIMRNLIHIIFFIFFNKVTSKVSFISNAAIFNTALLFFASLDILISN